MAKPIDDLSFWKKRIETATSEHYSVYVVHEAGWKKIFEKHCEIISKHIPKDVNVLDAGCGYGRMAPLFPKDDYLGIDFSPDFIQKAREKFPGYTFEVQNLKSLPYDNESFDWAILVSIKKMVRDNLGDDEWGTMEAEIKRVAKNVLVLEYEEPSVYEVL